MNRPFPRTQLNDLHLSAGAIAWSVCVEGIKGMELPARDNVPLIKVRANKHYCIGHDGWRGKPMWSWIELEVPSDAGPVPQLSNLASYRSIIAGALAHEYVHLLQIADAKSSYRTDNAHWETHSKNGTGSSNLIANYYSLASEQEAHGAQAAAEMVLLRVPFDKTFVWRHILWRLQGPLPGSIEEAIKSVATAYSSMWLPRTSA